MHDADRRKPSSDEAIHPFPGQAVALATAPERMQPVPADLDADGIGGPDVAGHGVEGEMTSHHARKAIAPVRGWADARVASLVPDLFQLRPQPLCDGDAPKPEASVPGLPANVREAQEVERLRLGNTPLDRR
jgi:hypothetical protein